MGLDTKIRIYDRRRRGGEAEASFVQNGVDHGGRIMVLYSQGVIGEAARKNSPSDGGVRWELWRYPGHRYRFGIDLYGYAPVEYAIARVWRQEFHFMGERPCRRLAGDHVVTVEPGPHWRRAVRHMKLLIDGLSSLDPWPVPKDDDPRLEGPAQFYSIERMKAALDYIKEGGR